MQITREESVSNLIRAFEPGRIRIGQQWLTGSLIVTADRIVSDWRPENAGRVTAADLKPALDHGPELIIVGGGTDAITPDVELMQELAGLAVGLEYMQTQAACRTYNVLVHEGRRVAAALILEAASIESR
ncbi:MAG: MTH938/NDUFAF3 family protein [Gammaproteobacteria bacterium]|jgi:uncharacterized protein